MKTGIITFFTGVFASVAALAANEGVPSYYQTSSTNANQVGYSQYQNQGYTKYVGQSGNKQVVGSRSYSYLTPGRYVGIAEDEGDGVPFEEKMTNLTGELKQLFEESKKQEEEIRLQLKKIGWEV